MFIPTNVLWWLAPDSMNQTYSNMMLSVNVINGTDVITIPTPISDYFWLPIGTQVSLDNSPNSYVVTSINGQELFIDSPILEADGTYLLQVAHIPEWINKANTSQKCEMVVNQNTPRFLPNKLNGFNAAFFPLEYHLKFDTPIYDFKNVEIFALFKERAGGYPTLFDHSFGDGMTWVRCAMEGGDLQLRYAKGDGVEHIVSTQNHQKNALEIGHWVIEENNGTYTFAVSKNGGVQSVATDVVPNGFLSSTEYLGIDKDSDYGFKGELYEFIITPILTPAERLKMEGYLAWKYDVKYLLPPTHLYKLVAPN